MMSDSWYETAPADSRLTQGDMILDCPLLKWDPTAAYRPNPADEGEVLRHFISPVRADVVVMTQACDLEREKVSSVVLCRHISISNYKSFWDERMLQVGQSPSVKAWRRTCDDIANGYVWNQAFLNSFKLDVDELNVELRIVDFHEIFTVPRTFLEGLIVSRGKPRLRLLPPYREHLSQSIARFFMRVGLPSPIEKVW